MPTYTKDKIHSSTQNNEARQKSSFALFPACFATHTCNRLQLPENQSSLFC